MDQATKKSSFPERHISPSVGEFAIQDRQALIEERDRLRSVNAELVEALARIMLASDRRMASGGDKLDFQDANRRTGDMARAALAKARA